MRLDAFAIPIFYDDLSSTVTKKHNADLWNDVIQHEASQDRSGRNVRQTSLGLEDKYKSFEDLSSIISIWAREKIREAGSELEYGKAMSFWGNYNNTPHAYHMPHAHTVNGFMWTGVYFPKSSSGAINAAFLESSNIPRPGSLVLLDPMGPMKTSCATADTRLYPYWGNPICIQPKESNVVLFPSYLPHMVTPTETGEERMSIAFSVAN